MLKTYLLIAIFLALLPYCVRSEIPDLKIANGTETKQGVVKLDWTVSGQNSLENYELQEANTPSFTQPKKRYDGNDTGTFISGLKNGTYYYRVRKVGDNWSNIVSVQIKHHSLTLAINLLILGAIVFIITTALILFSLRNQNK
ncbi:hypothetical protein ORI89_07070 [Sphingobacterium sp. UT-1RO-CII-1]|uniref:hypothetical protein n=1 Tax=Sphingobacterium sp. UT-1RO-CII-1 TaxID=2995225 RepID=UPI00227BB6EB|nr:hypothetical protein [Sphingobacterium sp. UT-1RO-CII-1]MCY4779405.1 hypothetical protein [Sphingobacterium sp. UT-1RO-CII-1]